MLWIRGPTLWGRPTKQLYRTKAPDKTIASPICTYLPRRRRHAYYLVSIDHWYSEHVLEVASTSFSYLVANRAPTNGPYDLGPYVLVGLTGSPASLDNPTHGRRAGNPITLTAASECTVLDTLRPILHYFIFLHFTPSGPRPLLGCLVHHLLFSVNGGISEGRSTTFRGRWRMGQDSVQASRRVTLY